MQVFFPIILIIIYEIEIIEKLIHNRSLAQMTQLIRLSLLNDEDVASVAEIYLKANTILFRQKLKSPVSFNGAEDVEK